MRDRGSPCLTIAVPLGPDDVASTEFISDLVAQSDADWELIVIGAATVGGAAFSERRIRYIDAPKAMPRGWRLNRALALARGAYFTALPPSGRLQPDVLRARIAALGAEAVGCIARTGSGTADPSPETLVIRTNARVRFGFFDTVSQVAEAEYADRLAARNMLSVCQEAPTATEAVPAPASDLASYREGYAAWHRQAGTLYLPFHQARRRFAPAAPAVAGTREHVTVSLATLPDRRAALAQTIDSILPWADRVNVFVNGTMDEEPPILADPRVRLHRSLKNIGDRGKFHWAGTLRDGYHFVCDDDILYSERYAETLIDAIERHERGAFVGLHGSRLRPGSQDFYSADRLVFNFRRRKVNDLPVQFLGTGVLAYHAGALQVDPAIFCAPNMADVFLGLEAERRRIPMICCAAEAGLVHPIPVPESPSIYGESVANATTSAFNRRAEVNRLLARSRPDEQA